MRGINTIYSFNIDHFIDEFKDQITFLLKGNDPFGRHSSGLTKWLNERRELPVLSIDQTTLTPYIKKISMPTDQFQLYLDGSAIVESEIGISWRCITTSLEKTHLILCTAITSENQTPIEQQFGYCHDKEITFEVSPNEEGKTLIIVSDPFAKPLNTVNYQVEFTLFTSEISIDGGEKLHYPVVKILWKDSEDFKLLNT